jgi:hypothetical protein
MLYFYVPNGVTYFVFSQISGGITRMALRIKAFTVHRFSCWHKKVSWERPDREYKRGSIVFKIREYQIQWTRDILVRFFFIKLNCIVGLVN